MFEGPSGGACEGASSDLERNERKVRSMIRRNSFMFLACMLLALAVPAFGEQEIRFVADSDTSSETVTVPCGACNKSGRCGSCCGSGSVLLPMGFMNCPMCFGQGKCTWCEGKGYNSHPKTTGGSVPSLSPGVGGSSFPMNPFLGGGSFSTGSGSSSSSTPGDQTCMVCYGLRYCHVCHGTRHAVHYVECHAPCYGACNYTGRCYKCGGTGLR